MRCRQAAAVERCLLPWLAAKGVDGNAREQNEASESGDAVEEGDRRGTVGKEASPDLQADKERDGNQGYQTIQNVQGQRCESGIVRGPNKANEQSEKEDGKRDGCEVTPPLRKMFDCQERHPAHQPDEQRHSEHGERDAGDRMRVVIRLVEAQI